MSAMWRRELRRRWALLLVLTLVSGAACEGDGERPPSKAARPSGEPIVVGFVNLEGSPAGSAPEIRIGSEAAVAYINAELDGVGGRPVELEVCVTNGSPESSTACANRMVERRVVAVVAGVDVGSAASLPILTAAGIPYISASPLLPPDFTTNGVFTFDPGGLATAASAAFAVDELGVDRVTILHADDAPGKQLAEAFVRPVLVKSGVRADAIRLVAEKLDAADVSPAVAAAAQGDPDAVFVVFPPPGCSRIMQAASALGVKASMFYIGRCSDPKALKAGGAGAEGAYFFSSVLNVDAHPDDADVKLYRAKVQRFGARDADRTSYDTARGFATTMTLHRRLSTLAAGEITPSTVSSAFRSAAGAPAFMAHPFTCDGRQAIPAFVSVCNSHVRIYQYAGGRYRDASGEWISAGAALAR